jgi:prevent-host-death family protein
MRCFMIEMVSTLEMRQRLGDLLNRVALRYDQFIIERKGKPLAAMVPVQRLEQMQEAARVHLLATLSKRSDDLSQSQADQLANDAKHRIRKSRRK